VPFTAPTPEAMGTTLAPVSWATRSAIFWSLQGTERMTLTYWSFMTPMSLVRCEGVGGIPGRSSIEPASTRPKRVRK